jgi:type I restriction enzyme S subunit
MDLNPEHHSILCDILASKLPGREVRIFGSRAIGTAKPYSDIDLVIMGDEPLKVTTMRILRDAFDDSDLPFQVDLVEWEGTSNEFRQVIAATAKTLEYCHDPLAS